MRRVQRGQDVRPRGRARPALSRLPPGRGPAGALRVELLARPSVSPGKGSGGVSPVLKPSWTYRTRVGLVENLVELQSTGLVFEGEVKCDTA